MMMEKNGASVLDKAASNGCTSTGVANIGSRLQTTESFPFKMGHNHHRPLVGDDSGRGGGSGPTPTKSGANEVLSNIYRDDFASASASSASGAGNGCAGSSVIVRTLQPFDNFSSTAFKSPGGMAANVGFPFTHAQWKELERQAMIYKYMMASVPVPADLLFPRNFPASASNPSASLGSGGVYSLRYSRNGDPEPGRCKRTDGKKWRCSRDVAPNQKYCERHLHRGRPRSRKHVEVSNNNNSTAPLNNSSSSKKTRLEQRPVEIAPSVVSHPKVQASSGTYQFLASNEASLLLNAKNDVNVSASAYKASNSGLSLMMGGEMAQLQQLMNTDMGLTAEGSIYSSYASGFHQDYVEQQPYNVLSYTDFPTPEDIVQNSVDECSAGVFLNPDLVQPSAQIVNPRGFINAWASDSFSSKNEHGKAHCAVSSEQGNLFPSSLTLTMAMAAGNVLDEEMLKIQVDGGVRGSSGQGTKDSSWLSPVSWLPFAQGGPLAEALQPGSVVVESSNPTSPHASNGDSTSPPTTTVSSPSGVLHKTLFSHSDSSVCNSPTLVASAAQSEVAGLHWFN